MFEVFSARLDPDPDWIGIQQQPGSRIRIQASGMVGEQGLVNLFPSFEYYLPLAFQYGRGRGEIAVFIFM
jgi:hypothetical protein